MEHQLATNGTKWHQIKVDASSVMAYSASMNTSERIAKLEALEDLLNWYREERRAAGFEFGLDEIEMAYGVLEDDLASTRERAKAVLS